MSKSKYNHDRKLESFKEQLEIIRHAGFKPIAVSQLFFEDVFVFETEHEALKAYDQLEKRERKLTGWWYSRKGFMEAVEEYERDALRAIPEESNYKVLTYWLHNEQD